MTHRLRLAFVPAFLLLCLLLGGASAAGWWANLSLELAALVLLFVAAASRRATPLSGASRQALGLASLVLLLFAVQLVPLPPALWTHLPGRVPVADGFRLLGLPLPWLPLSLEPYKTIGSALWLLPAAAVLAGIVILGAYRSSWLAWVLAGVTIVSVAIGALQLAGGENGSAYFYQITNTGAMTGFFANANHLATLLLVTLPFLAALHLNALNKGRSLKKSSGLLVVLAGTGAVIVVGLAGATSIAGAGLAVPVTAASILLVLSRKRRVPAWSAALLAVLLAASVAGAFAAPFNNNLTGERSHTSEDSRRTSFAITARAAREYLPFGSGIGTFQQVYREHESPAAVGRFFMNHAHGDYLELALETGLPGLLLVLAFVLWWLRRTFVLWTREEGDPFARAATIAIGAMLAHSMVDYPLRTAALGAVFAMCCGLIADPRAKVQARTRRDGTSAARHLSAD
ncbi:MAG: O-antigen ligase family protein [Alphaproteobacteria bacterium]|nr:O-antigen ligase family protein [Alphaproteobacteria bacterium]